MLRSRLFSRGVPLRLAYSASMPRFKASAMNRSRLFSLARRLFPHYFEHASHSHSLRQITVLHHLTNTLASVRRMLPDPLAPGLTYALTPCRLRPSRKLFRVARRSPTSASPQCTFRATLILLSIAVHDIHSSSSHRGPLFLVHSTDRVNSYTGYFLAPVRRRLPQLSRWRERSCGA